MKYECELCNYKTNRFNDLEKHQNTKKHNRNMYVNNKLNTNNSDDNNSVIENNDDVIEINDTIINKNNSCEKIKKEKKYLESSKKSTFSNPIFDKTWRSRFGDIHPFNDGYPRNTKDVYMSDYIMFNPNCNITIDTVDRVLPYCKFKQIDHDTCQIDKWIYKEKGFFIVDSTFPNYDITLSDEDTSEMDFIKTEEEKRLAVRAFLAIMHETPDEYTNFNSYNVIGNWYVNNDSWLVCWNINNYVEPAEKIKQLKTSDCIINLDGKLTRNELIDILYSYAKFGESDLIKTGLKYKKPEIFYDNITDDNVTKINDADIHVLLNLKQINISEYLKCNGNERTTDLINAINRQIKTRFNCTNVNISITKGELLAKMYNVSLPMGLGVLNADDKIMTFEEAEQILKENNDYIGYLKGVPIKTHFGLFPIIDYYKFDDYHRPGKFKKCIESFSNNDVQIEKKSISFGHIFSELRRVT